MAGVDGSARDVIQAPKPEPRIMRYELSDYEWTAIKPMLPNKPRGVRRVNDRRVLNGIFWVLRSGAPWRDLPEVYGPRTTCYNRFVRWRRAGVWDQIMDALAAGHDAAVQMIDTSVVRVHQHGTCIADNNHQDMGRSRGGLTSKIHAVVDTNGLPVHLALPTRVAVSVPPFSCPATQILPFVDRAIAPSEPHQRDEVDLLVLVQGPDEARQLGSDRVAAIVPAIR